MTMKYFITETERQSLHSSDFYEFQKGRFDGEHWKEDSLCLPSDMFFALNLDTLFFGVLLDFNAFGPTEITKADWQRLRAAMEAAGGEIKAIADELAPWAEECLAEEGIFTICGV